MDKRNKQVKIRFFIYEVFVVFIRVENTKYLSEKLSIFEIQISYLNLCLIDGRYSR